MTHYPPSKHKPGTMGRYSYTGDRMTRTRTNSDTNWRTMPTNAVLPRYVRGSRPGAFKRDASLLVLPPSGLSARHARAGLSWSRGSHELPNMEDLKRRLAMTSWA